MLERRTTVALGTFDGVHKAHRVLIDRARALEADAVLTAITFDSVPSSVLSCGKVAQVVTCDDKVRLLYEAGADKVEVIPFDRKLYSMEAEDFFKEVLLGRFHASSIAVGHDYRFGSGGRGDVQLLERLCEESGMRIYTLGELSEGDIRISSSEIRRRISDGIPDGANRMLGRVHFFRATLSGEHLKPAQGIALPPSEIRFRTKAFSSLPVLESFSEYDSIFWVEETGKDTRIQFEGLIPEGTKSDIYLLFGPQAGAV